MMGGASKTDQLSEKFRRGWAWLGVIFISKYYIAVFGQIGLSEQEFEKNALCISENKGG